MNKEIKRNRHKQGKTVKREYINTWLKTAKQEQIERNNLLFKEARKLKKQNKNI